MVISPLHQLEQQVARSNSQRYRQRKQLLTPPDSPPTPDCASDQAPAADKMAPRTLLPPEPMLAPQPALVPPVLYDRTLIYLFDLVSTLGRLLDRLDFDEEDDDAFYANDVTDDFDYAGEIALIMTAPTRADTWDIEELEENGGVSDSSDEEVSDTLYDTITKPKLTLLRRNHGFVPPRLVLRPPPTTQRPFSTLPQALPLSQVQNGLPQLQRKVSPHPPPTITADTPPRHPASRSYPVPVVVRGSRSVLAGNQASERVDEQNVPPAQQARSVLALGVPTIKNLVPVSTVYNHPNFVSDSQLAPASSHHVPTLASTGTYNGNPFNAKNPNNLRPPPLQLASDKLQQYGITIPKMVTHFDPALAVGSPLDPPPQLRAYTYKTLDPSLAPGDTEPTTGKAPQNYVLNNVKNESHALFRADVGLTKPLVVLRTLSTSRQALIVSKRLPEEPQAFQPKAQGVEAKKLTVQFDLRPQEHSPPQDIYLDSDPSTTSPQITQGALSALSSPRLQPPLQVLPKVHTPAQLQLPFQARPPNSQKSNRSSMPTVPAPSLTQKSSGAAAKLAQNPYSVYGSRQHTLPPANVPQTPPRSSLLKHTNKGQGATMVRTSSPQLPSGHTLDMTPEARTKLALQFRNIGKHREALYQLQIAALPPHNFPKAMFLYAMALRFGTGVKQNNRHCIKWLCKCILMFNQPKALADIVDKLNALQPEDLVKLIVKKLAYDLEKDAINNGLDPYLLHNTMSRLLKTDILKIANTSKNQSDILAVAYFELANAVMNGWGLSAKDESNAISILSKSAAMGYVQAMLQLGELWTTKTKYHKKDMARAAAWLRLLEIFGAKQLGNSWIYKEKYMKKPK